MLVAPFLHALTPSRHHAITPHSAALAVPADVALDTPLGELELRAAVGAGTRQRLLHPAQQQLFGAGRHRLDYLGRRCGNISYAVGYDSDRHTLIIPRKTRCGHF